MTSGDIYSVEIPSSDGHEQAGTRPAIVVQADWALSTARSCTSR